MLAMAAWAPMGSHYVSPQRLILIFTLHCLLFDMSSASGLRGAGSISTEIQMSPAYSMLVIFTDLA